MALNKSFILNGILNGDVVLNVASDNGFVIFVNGHQIAKENAEGYSNYWEYSFVIDQSLFKSGINFVQVFAEDHGGSTLFDMQLQGDISPTPEPATLILLGIGMMVGVYAKRRKV